MELATAAAASSSSSSSSLIWASLPQALLERILSFLPLSSLARFRLVSKSWNLLIRTNPSPTHPWILRHNKRCPQSSHAFECATPRLWRPWTFPFPFPAASHCRVLSTSGALVLLVLSGDASPPASPLAKQQPFLVVWHPLRLTWRRLPPCTLVQGGFVYSYSFVRLPDRSFKILLTSFGATSDYSTLPSATFLHVHITEVYDSAIGRWTRGKPSLLSYVSKCTSNILWFKDRFHCILHGNLWAYDVHERSWSKITRSTVDNPAVFTILVSNGALLFKIPFVPGVRSLHAWELDQARMEWVSAKALPDTLAAELWDEEMDLWHIWRDWRECCVQGESILFCLAKNMSRILLYNVSTNTWYPVDIPPSSFDSDILNFHYQPDFLDSF